MGIADDFDPVADMVEEEKGIGKEETGVIDVEFVGILIRQFLKETDHIVAEKADGSAAKAGQVGRFHIAVATQQLFKQGKWIDPLGDRDFACSGLVGDGGAVPFAAEDQGGVAAKKGVPPDPLAALHAL